MKILQIKTIQCLILKSLFESLKEIVFDVNIYFTNKSIKIMKMDHSHSMVLLLELFSSQFELYKCGKQVNNQYIEYTEDNPLIVGLNVLYLFKLLKNLTNDDVLQLSIDDNNPGYLEIEIEKTCKNIISKYNLSLIELNEETLKPNELNYNNIIYMNSSNFFKIIKEMNQYSKVLEIKYYNEQLTLSCKGDFTSQETIITSKSDTIQFVKTNNQIYQSYFKLKNLTSFMKFTNLSQKIKISFDNEYPLLLDFKIGNLGNINIYISQTSDKK